MDDTARAAAHPIDASRSRVGSALRNDTHAETSFGRMNPDTPSSISLAIGPPGTLTTALAHAMYSGTFSVENTRPPSKNARVRYGARQRSAAAMYSGTRACGM